MSTFKVSRPRRNNKKTYPYWSACRTHGSEFTIMFVRHTKPLDKSIVVTPHLCPRADAQSFAKWVEECVVCWYDAVDCELTYTLSTEDYANLVLSRNNWFHVNLSDSHLAQMARHSVYSLNTMHGMEQLEDTPLHIDVNMYLEKSYKNKIREAEIDRDLNTIMPSLRVLG